MPPAIRLVACHRLPERSFFWAGRQFPVCARCTGMLAGYLAFPLFLFHLVTPGWALSLAANLPALADGLTQAWGGRESSNPLRFATGLAAGVGQVGLIQAAGDWAASLIVPLILGR